MKPAHPHGVCASNHLLLSSPASTGSDVDGNNPTNTQLPSAKYGGEEGIPPSM